MATAISYRRIILGVITLLLAPSPGICEPQRITPRAELSPLAKLAPPASLAIKAKQTGPSPKLADSGPQAPRYLAVHRVATGESLERIAHRYRMSLSQLIRLNAERIDSELNPGTELHVIVTGAHPSDEHDDFFCLVDGPGYRVRRPDRAWGTLKTVTYLRETFAAYQRTFPTASPIPIFDLSKHGGGDLPPHLSHDKGIDVDIPYVLKPDYGNRAVRAKGYMLNLRRTWFLLRSLLATEDVAYIFMDHDLQRPLYHYARGIGVPKTALSFIFQYPRSPETRVGIIRDDPGHDTHFHVRFGRQESNEPTQEVRELRQVHYAARDRKAPMSPSSDPIDYRFPAEEIRIN